VDIDKIINLKKNGEKLSRDIIEFVVDGYRNSKIDDREMVEFLKSINETNFSYEETFFLADVLANTGDRLDISNHVDFVVDKHSAGNISDPTTLIYMAVMATLGVKNCKVLSGAYGDFGSSLERFKFFKNFDAKITKEQLYDSINEIGFGVFEEDGQIAPVDKKLYSLRKKENIVSIPLTAASILAKKIATGVNAVIYDVKAGEGAIYPTKEFSYTLANYLVNATKFAGIKSVGVITNLDQTLGSSIGPRAELEEAINVLRCERSLYGAKLLDVAKELVVVSLMLVKKVNSRSDAVKLFDDAINSGKALDKFRELIKRYGGIYEDFKHTSQRLLSGVSISYITAKEDGIINDIVLSKLTNAYKKLSQAKTKKYDKNASLVILVREGQKVRVGQKLMRVFYSINNKAYFESVNDLSDSFYINKTKPNIHKVFYKVVL